VDVRAGRHDLVDAVESSFGSLISASGSRLPARAGLVERVISDTREKPRQAFGIDRTILPLAWLLRMRSAASLARANGSTGVEDREVAAVDHGGDDVGARAAMTRPSSSARLKLNDTSWSRSDL
jgi:hypothetical protein